MNIIKGKIIEKTSKLYFESHAFEYPIPSKFSNLKNYLGKEIILGIRPEHIRINENLPSSIIRCNVEVIEPLGATTVIFASLDIDTEITIIKEGLVEYKIEEEIEIACILPEGEPDNIQLLTELIHNLPSTPNGRAPKFELKRNNI